jgi:hypothetical protein
MPGLFQVPGDHLDLGYINLRDDQHPGGRAIARALDAMWTQFQPYADPSFEEEFARNPEARFWEMFVGCALLSAGKTLRPAINRHRDGGQPDICVIEDGRRIWIEAIAPDAGDNPDDRVPDITPINEGGRIQRAPNRQVQLRITSALWTKSQKVARYIAEGVIDADEVCLIATGGCHFGIYAGGMGLPLAVSSVFPIGNYHVQIRRDTLEVAGEGYARCEEIPREEGAIPRTAFMDDRFSHISGMIWSRVSIGNMNRAERPLSLIHNLVAANPIPRNWGVWDREFVCEDDGESWTVTDILGNN